MIKLVYGGNSVPVHELELGDGIAVEETSTGLLKLTTNATSYGGQTTTALKNIFIGFGSPEGVVAGPVSSIYGQRDQFHDNPLWVRVARPDLTTAATDLFGTADTDIDGRALTAGTWDKNDAVPASQIDTASDSAHNAISGTSLYTVSGLSLGADYAVRATYNRVTTGAAAGEYVGVCARYDAALDSGYRLRLEMDGTLQLHVVTTGSATLLASKELQNFTTGAGTLELRVQGNNIAAYWEGFQVFAVWDDTYTAVGRPGLYLLGASSAGALFKVDDFVVSSLAADDSTLGWRPLFEGQTTETVQIGVSATAMDTYTTAIGPYALATSEAVAIGAEAWASDFGTAVGNYASTNSSGVAVGIFTTAPGATATALGPFATASGSSSIAIGDSSSVTAGSPSGIAIGVSASCSHVDCVVIGIVAQSNEDHAIKIVGRSGSYFNLFHIGEGDRANSTSTYTGRTTKMDDLTWRMARAVAVGSTTASAWSNLPGGDFIFEGSRGTGAGAGGKYRIRLGKTVGGATTIHDLETVVEYDGKGNIALGKQAALATTDTDGFLYVPNCPGVPTGVPTGVTGLVPLVVDSTNQRLYAYLGGAWVQL